MEVDINALIEQFQPMVVDAAIALVKAIAFFVIGRWVAKAVTKAVKKAMARSDVEDTLETFVGNIVYTVLMAAVLLGVISTLGVEVTSLVALLGAAGLAVGLALQGSLSNFAAGVLIILFKPYRVGDYIEAAGVAGSVESLQIFTTVLKTPDNKVVIVPNSQVTDGVITNYSTNDTRRLDLIAGVSYSDDLDKVRNVLTEIIDESQYVLDTPAPTIAVSELADSSVNFVVRPWVKTADYWNAHFTITETIKKRFDAEGISIPFPQQDVYVHQVGD
ncbi:MAG: mechanosensitive ion channel domain-containing protein [Pseudomonadota bacterium]